MSDEVREYMAGLKAEREATYAEWKQTYEAWRAANPEKAAELDDSREIAIHGISPEECSALIPEFPADSKLATRASAADAENARTIAEGRGAAAS